ncbi:MAG: ribonuclease HI [Candidatus Paceibacterota bacterium]|jgi:ribonuclease HI
MTANSVIIFTDGSSKGNPGPGGFGAVIIVAGKVMELGGGDPHTTNNRMEIQAAISALAYIANLEGRLPITVYTDSAYLLNGITKWVFGWRQNGWKTSTKQPVENQDLWEELFDITKSKKINWYLVKGHVGVAGNHRCDEIATLFADGKQMQLYSGALENYSIKDILNISANPAEAEKRADSKSRSRAKAFCYVSLVDGEVLVHKTWAECEKRVKGKSGARFQKVFSKSEEDSLVKEWGS